MNRIAPVAIFTAVGCIACGVPEEEHAAALQRIEALSDSLELVAAEVVVLRDQPAERLSRGTAALAAGERGVALNAFRSLVGKYPASAEAATANLEIARIEREIEAERAEQERRTRLGFKALRANARPDLGAVKLRINSASTRERWIFDRYDNRWHYRDAERGQRHVVVDVTVTAEGKSPMLPALRVYRVNGEQLRSIGTMRYEFYRWRDYGAYLGNYSDNNNDFAHSESVRFVAGLAIPAASAGNPLFILADKVGCARRVREEFGSPEVKYDSSGCTGGNPLTLETVEQEKVVVAILNGGAL